MNPPTQKMLGESLARSQVARANPRDMKVVRHKLLELCRRIEFASFAVYEKPGVEKNYIGLSVRFAEDMLSIYTNLEVDVMQTQDGLASQDWKVVVIDLETNVVVSEEVSVPKLVERPVLNGAAATGTTDTSNLRTRGDGVLVHTVMASPDEVNAQRLDRCARLRRQLIIQKLPAELRQECLTLCLETIAQATEVNADEARKQLVASFEEIGVTLDDLKAYLGHSMKSVTDDEALQLRNILNAIREGEATWPEYLASKRSGSKRTREIKQRASDNKKPGEARPRRSRSEGKPNDAPAVPPSDATPPPEGAAS
jgi:hypothetical protein